MNKVIKKMNCMIDSETREVIDMEGAYKIILELEQKLKIAEEALELIKHTEDYLAGDVRVDAKVVYHTGYLRGVSIAALEKIKGEG